MEGEAALDGVCIEGEVRPLVPKKREMRPEDFAELARLKLSIYSQRHKYCRQDDRI